MSKSKSKSKKSNINWQEIFEKIENEGLDYWLDEYSDEVYNACPEAQKYINLYFEGKAGILLFLKDKAVETDLEFDENCI